ncbi:MAG: RyR domain-containing protein [Armatimonadota bacterium]
MEKEIPSIAEWKKTTPEFRESSIEHVRHFEEKLRQIGWEIQPLTPGADFTFTAEEIETLAEMEHARWSIERLREGWRYGSKRDDIKRLNPYLVGWEDLPGDIKQWDRIMVTDIAELLPEYGLMIVRH